MEINPLKFITAFLVAVLVVSCTTTLEPTNPDSEIETQELTITALMETDGATKTELSDARDGSVLWTPGDEISLFCGSGTAGGYRFTSTATEPVAVTDFTGTVEAPIAWTAESYYWGLYPYSSTATCDGSSVTMTLPAEQTAKAGSFATETAPSLGRSRNTTMGFYNICGGIKFSVTHEGIKKVTFQSNNGEPVAGTARVAFDEAGRPVVQEITTGTDAVTLEAPEGEYFEVGEYYYLMLFPTALTSGFTLTLESLTESTTVVMNGQININRAFFGRMTNVDSGATYTPISGNIPIPDANFKAYLVENFDTDSDGEISIDEALQITTIDVCTDNIASVKGIEYCRNLATLICSGSDYAYGSTGQLTNLDVSNNTALTYLNCRCNQLVSLDVSKNTALTYLECPVNQLTALDVSNNTALTSINLSGNQVSSLDISNNAALDYLYCYGNQLSSLDVSNNTALTFLGCDVNQITNLDISNNTALERLSCFANQLTSLDISNNSALISINCNCNQLTSLDVSNNTALTYLNLYGNQLTNLNVSNNTALTTLYCFDNQISSLDLTYNTALTDFSCANNQLTSLDVSNNTALTNLSCELNQLTTLDISNNTALTGLDCSPMNDSQNNNLLATLFIAPGQCIPHVTTERSTDYIPVGTEIVEKTISGGNEGYGEGDLVGVPQAIDLGLSVKWASFNLGASAPEGYGNYYAWGETEPKDNYNWSTYKWGNGHEFNLTKYNTNYSYGTEDNITTLEESDDVAHVKLGGTWRMPTQAEWEELLSTDNSNWTWTTQNGVNGLLVTSKNNGNSIFLPATGARSGTTLFDVGSYGDYWSSSLDTDYPTRAFGLYFASSDMCRITSDRYHGFSVRPVSE